MKRNEIDNLKTVKVMAVMNLAASLIMCCITFAVVIAYAVGVLK
ncbi:MAG: hypothetical protein [Bacteriophage sp.]|nr:MAG: hypothetical protein [Bacteriophage sp.]